MRHLPIAAILSVMLGSCANQSPLIDPKACSANILAVQIMGSGGPIADDHRGGTGNIVWVDGKARVVVDAGPGSFIRHGEAGVDFRDHIAILLTHYHGDHVGGLPGLLNNGSFAGRRNNLLVAGPKGSDLFPSTSELLAAFVGEQGALRYLSSYLKEGGPHPKLIIRDIEYDRDYMQVVHRKDDVDIDAIPVHHLSIPALAYVVRTKGKRLLFAGDQSFLSDTFEQATRNGQPDIMFMHNAISMAEGQPRGLHRDGVSIGEAAQSAGAKKLVLTHHMQRALNDKDAVLAAIRENFEGPLEFADDLSCYELIK